jgi:carboxymethylenebutenolidase
MSGRGGDVDLACGTGPRSSVRGYLALPASSAGAGVLVLGEASGPSSHLRDVSDRLAREGFVAFAPDLSPDARPSDRDGDEWALDLTVAGEGVDAAVVSLLSHDATVGASVGCLGFGAGGSLALAAATRSPRIGAVVDCYGAHTRGVLDLSGMRATVLGIFAENDDVVAAGAAQALEAELREAGIRAEVKVHVGVGNAFLNESRADAYDAPSAREAWNDILSFFRAEAA